MRPDVCGAIVMFDHIHWQGVGVIVAVATGHDIPPATFQWLKGLASIWQKNLLAIEFEQDDERYSGDYQLRMLGPEAFKRDMVDHFKRVDVKRHEFAVTWLHD
jgi:hypothetical protein